MELNYYRNCPSCGATIELGEADRLVECPFCDVKNYMVQKGPLRFILPSNCPSEIAQEDIIYIPYLRFKGHIYSCQGKQVHHKIVDTTHLGVKTETLPVSLGLRPQAMKVAIAASQQSGRFVKLSEKVQTIFSHAAKIIDVFSQASSTLYHRSYIGETVSFIYLPTYIKDDKLIDAVLNREMTKVTGLEKILQQTTSFKNTWLPGFISTLCPHCAEVMNGAHDSLVLLCPNCHSIWQEENGKLKKIEWSLLPSAGDESLHLPFWKIRADAAGVALSSYSDFIRLTNQPIVARQVHDGITPYFWIPAFKINPRYFLHFAKNLMVSQIHLPQGGKIMAKNLHPVTMPVTEAMQALKTVIATAVMNKRTFLPMLPALSFQARKNELVYLPFKSVGHDLVQEHTSVTVAGATLRFGRSM